MNGSLNIGNAILILGILYFKFVYGLVDWIAAGLILLSLATWAYYGCSKEKKEYFKARNELLKAKTEYYKRKSLGC